MRFNPKARIDNGGVSDAGGSTGGGAFPIPSRGGAGKTGLVIMLISLLLRWFMNRRRTA